MLESVSPLARDLIAVTAIGGTLALDRRAAFQLMVSQPLVVIPILGLFLGNLPTALWLGALVQLLWMSSLLVGASVPPNETLSSLVIGGAALLFGRHVGPIDLPVMALCILLGAPVSLLGRLIDIQVDRENLALAHRADLAAAAGTPGVISRLPLIGLFRTFVAEAGLVAAGTSIAFFVVRAVHPALTPTLIRALDVIALYLVPALGRAVAMTTVRRRRALALAGTAFVVVVSGLRYLEVQ